MPTRPPLDSSITEAEFVRWYWLRDELAQFARELGISASGHKRELTQRIASRLGGRSVSVPARRVAGVQLSGHLSRETVIPPGQRSSQQLRAFFEAELGPSFHFDAAMRDFISSGAGRTLGDALEHWRASRGAGPVEIDPQFEYNRFTRQWHQQHPQSTRQQLLDAWWEYRASPRDTHV